MYAFISGVPAAGKTYLAKSVIDKAPVKIEAISIDGFRKTLKDPRLVDWVNFFRNKNEKEYWEKTSGEEHMKNITKQSLGLWPSILKYIKNEQKRCEHAIFDGVNIIPKLAKDLDFAGVYLIQRDPSVILSRLKLHKRWGETLELKQKEAQIFANDESDYYQNEAERYNLPVFDSTEQAEKKLLEIFSS